MISKCKLKWILLTPVFFVLSNDSYILASKIGTGTNFGSKDSAIKISKLAKLNIENNFVVDEGSVSEKAPGLLNGTITFSNGNLETVNSKSFLNGTFQPNPTQLERVSLIGGGFLDADPGSVYQRINVSGTASIEGQPNFDPYISLFPDTGIVLQDAATFLNLGIQSKLNANITLNDGTVSLEDDLKFDDDSMLLGNGIVRLNSKQVSFGGKDSTWSNNIYWDNASDMILNSRLNLTGVWTFEGENHISGNGNILDLGSGAKLWVKHGATLHLRDIKLRGLGAGSIVFEDRTSQVRFSDSQVEMNSNYTVTEGGIYVDGESTIYTKNWVLNFDQRGSMTVDGTCLWYDLLDQEDDVVDPLTIKPGRTDDLAQKYIAYLNDGVIRQVIGVPAVGPIIWWGVDYLHQDLWLSPHYRAIVTDDKVVFGESHSIHFSRTSDQIYIPLIEIKPGKKLTFLNIVLENFSPEHLKFGTDSTISFSDKTTIELCRDEELNMTWTFRGNCILRGNGHSLKLGPNGNIVIAKSDVRHSALLFDDITIKGITGNNIRCIDNTGTMSFSSVNWMQDSNYSLTVGKMAIIAALNMSGDVTNVTFSYMTDQVSTIAKFANLSFGTGFRFSYAPITASRNLIQMEDASSNICLNGATLSSTTTGLNLTRGTLILDHKNLLYNTGATSLSQAIKFGDGISSSNNLGIEVMPGGSIDLKSGLLDYCNV